MLHLRPLSDASRPTTVYMREAVINTSLHRCKNVFTGFFILVTFFTFSNVFVIFQTFFYLKNGKLQSGKQINKKHFQNNSNKKDL